MALILGVGTAAGALTSVMLWRRVAALEQELQSAKRKKGGVLVEKSRGITPGGPTMGRDDETLGGDDLSSDVEAFGQGEDMDSATFAQQMLSQKNELLNLLQDVSSTVGAWETKHKALQERLHKNC